MKTYIGTKQVKAEPMLEEEAVKRGYARQPKDYNHKYSAGYHVQYTNPDGSTYDSWSPCDVFIDSYRIAETPLDRMRIERRQLNERIDRLRKFVESDKYKDITELQRYLLAGQLEHMEQYSDILNLRIDDLVGDLEHVSKEQA